MNQHAYHFLFSACTLLLICLAAGWTGAADARERQPGRSGAKRKEPKIKILDGKPKTIIVNGYSTSFRWPKMLQRKLDRFFKGRRVLTVVSATKGGTPIAKWMDPNTGQPKPPWLQILRPKLKEQEKSTVIVLAQQSLQWAFGRRSDGISDARDTSKIKRGADVLEKYVRLLLSDGADLVFLAMHIYKKPMEPQIANERLALQELVKRSIPNFLPGPDVWTPTSKLYPEAFGGDKVHPNDAGAEVMAHYWFETLCKHDGVKVPSWSKEEMEKALSRTP